MAAQSNTETGSSLGKWVQQALFTRAADSYFSPLVEGVAPALVFSKRYRQARVVKIKHHNNQAATLTVIPPRGWLGFLPGQYVSCEFEIKGIRRKRNYSISSSYRFLEKTGQIQLTVHRVEGGVVSNFVLDEMRLDTRFFMSDAMGEFGQELEVPEPNRQRKPLLLLAAGSGITPFASMISSGQTEGRKTLLVYSAAKANEHLFKHNLESLAEQSSHFTVHFQSTREEASGGRVDADLLVRLCHEKALDPGSCEVFICGGQGFTDAMSEAVSALGVEGSAIHFESFDSQLLFSEDAQQDIHFISSDKRIHSKSADSVLEQAEAAGLSPQNGCRMGICHSCTCKKQRGVVRNLLTGELSSADEEEIRICVSQAVGEVEIDL